MLRVSKIETCFDTLQPHVHLRLHSLAAEVIAAQAVNVLADGDKLPWLVGKHPLCCQ